MFYLSKSIFFSTFTTGCDFRKYENEIKQKLYIKLIYKE